MTQLAPAVSIRFPASPRRAVFARRGSFVILLTLAFGFNRAAQAGVDRWTPFGPGDGALRSLVASSRGELYTTTSFSAGEIWQRPTATASWRWRGQGLGRPGTTSPIALAVHPKNPAALWAVVPNPGGTVFESVFRSTDGGASWHKVFTGDDDFRIVRWTVAPTANSVVLLGETGGGTAGLLRSADLGASWTEVPGVVGPVAAAPDEPGVVYAVDASGSGVAKSIDGGKTFRSTGNLPVAAGDEIHALHATYGRPALVLASARAGGLFRSTNGGGSWRRCGFVGSGPSALASEPTNPRKIYAAVSGVGIYASDLGAQNGTFRSIASFLFTPLQIVATTALVAAPGGPYFLAGAELYRAGPQGFGPVIVSGIEAFGVAELRISQVDPSFVAVRRYTGCIGEACDFRTLLSIDGGITFARLGALVLPRLFSDVFDLAFDPTVRDRWLLASGFGVLLRDPGESGLGKLVLAAPVTTVEIAADGVLLAGGTNGILRSENDGTSWETTLDATFPSDPQHLFPGFRRVVDLVAHPYAPERVIARSLEFISSLPHDSGRIVLYRSEDAGRTWTWQRDGNADVEFIPGAPASFYLLFGTVNGTELRRSDDFGATSALIRTFPTLDAVSDVATDKNAPGDLYAATRTGVQRSRDGGFTWEATPGGFNPFGPYRRWVSAVQVAPDRAGRLLASPLDGGLFENRLSN